MSIFNFDTEDTNKGQFNRNQILETGTNKSHKEDSRIENNQKSNEEIRIPFKTRVRRKKTAKKSKFSFDVNESVEELSASEFNLSPINKQPINPKPIEENQMNLIKRCTFTNKESAFLVYLKDFCHLKWERILSDFNNFLKSNKSIQDLKLKYVEILNEKKKKKYHKEISKLYKFPQKYPLQNGPGSHVTL